MQTDKKYVTEEKETHTFIREEGRWFISLDDDRSHGYTKKDLELTAGTKILNKLSGGRGCLRLHVSSELLEGAELLELVERCASPRGGGIYLLNPEREHDGSLYWICDFALLVFGDLPEQIYLKRLPLLNEEMLNEVRPTVHSLQPNQNVPWFAPAE